MWTDWTCCLVDLRQAFWPQGTKSRNDDTNLMRNNIHCELFWFYPATRSIWPASLLVDLNRQPNRMCPCNAQTLAARIWSLLNQTYDFQDLQIWYSDLSCDSVWFSITPMIRDKTKATALYIKFTIFILVSVPSPFRPAVTKCLKYLRRPVFIRGCLLNQYPEHNALPRRAPGIFLTYVPNNLHLI